MPKTTRYYEFRLPVYKQGDDMDRSLGECDNIAKDALLLQAEIYEDAASRCRRLASVAAEMPSLKIQGCTHHIGVSSDDTVRLDALVADGLLDAEDYEEEEDEEDYLDEGTDI